jgi:nicotinamidase-related amidase
MPIDLETLIAPSHTALVTQECQEGVLGERSSLPALAEAARQAGLVERIDALATAARAAGVAVLHCLIARRPDNRGSNANARLFVAAGRSPQRMVHGSPVAGLVSGIGQEESDIVLTRMQGLSPMTGTELDPVLRHLGCTTIVGVGVSVNVAITNFAFDAVNRGYQFVIPRDAVTGVPAEYAAQVLDHTLSLVATVTDTDAVLEAWGAR